MIHSTSVRIAAALTILAGALASGDAALACGGHGAIRGAQSFQGPRYVKLKPLPAPLPRGFYLPRGKRNPSDQGRDP